MINENILTKDERTAFKSMALYWKEVRGREDQTPLGNEAVIVFKRLGVRVLDLVEHYIETTEPEKE